MLLVETYGRLLNPNLRKYVTQRYFDDLSLAEIAALHKVSRFAVQDAIKRAVAQLEKAERALRLVSKRASLLEAIEEIADERVRKKVKRLV